MVPQTNGKPDLADIIYPYLLMYRSKGRQYAYYRRSGIRQRVHGVPGSADFQRNYDRIHASFEDKGRITVAAPGTLAKLVLEYKYAPEFKQLRASTRQQYAFHLDFLSEKWGDLDVATMPRSFALKLRDKYADTPAKANHLLRILSLLMAFGVDRGYRAENPLLRIKKLKVGHRKPLEEYEVEAFRKVWATDTRERVAFELMLNTGQRRGDVVTMQRQHYRDGEIQVMQEKTGARVWIPASADLRAILDPWLAKHDHMMVLTTKTGRAMTPTYFGHMMTAAFREANLDATSHGLRYTAATRLRELGCDHPTIASITGHRTAEMVRQYSEQRRRSQLAIAKVNRATRDSENEARTKSD